MAERITPHNRALSWRMVGRFGRFLLVGGFCAALAWAIFRGGVALGLHYLAANALSWVGGVIVGFLLNRRVAFQSGGSWGPQFVLFAGGQGAMLGLSSVGLVVLMGCFKLDPTLAFIVNTGALSLLNFVWLNGVAFRR